MLLKKLNFFICRNLKVGRCRVDGRNNTGLKTIHHRGGGHKRVFRLIDFKRYIWAIPALPLTNEYDPNRTAVISLLSYSNGTFSYILAPDKLRIAYPIAAQLFDNKLINIPQGCCSFVGLLKPGSYINSVEIRPLCGAQYVRTGGAFAKLVSVTVSKYAIIKLKSKVLLRISATNIATLGVLGFWSSLLYLKKNAGNSRLRGRKPVVRGVAKNPIDHPHGGGQGKTSGGRVSVTPWARITKGKKTCRKIKYVNTVLKK